MQQERLTIQEAAHRLGVSESAIRKRIKRGTLKREKTEDGRVLVYMESTSVPGTEEVRTPERDALISEMQERLAFLERELDVRAEEIRRRDTIIMNMTEAMKALSPPPQETPSDERESPETVEEAPEGVESTSYTVEVHESSREATEAHEAAEEQQGRGQSHSATGGAQEGAQRVSWWRRMFRR
jgi:excisionase family DNA binding protein